ncbi:MAG TPA: hypothetical protein VG722_04165 [Tepidisphaeraceae bacterium]|nr:hypothetical protein [Tepidisphaeraceae bacterium]
MNTTQQFQRLPNIFNFATTELSQDAAICYLLEWADERFAKADPALNACAGPDR